VADATTGRVVLVTGGTRGIGLACARAFSAQGDRVAVTHRTDPVEGVLSVPCDVSSAADVDAAFKTVEDQLGKVEVLVANAGITRDNLLLRMSDEDFTTVIDTNLTGVFRAVKRAVPGMLRARKGRIVMISSVVGLLGSAGQVNYAASKSGLVGLTRSLVRELGGRDITANVVAPGFVQTDMTAGLSADRRDEIMRLVPLGRMASAEEIAGVVTWLASEAAAYITGAVIPVDGGLGMGH
jgi:3-oxoacyl-[acyl-carrier protein] reductase